MKRVISAVLFSTALLATGASLAQAVVGQTAPAFSAIDTAGRTVSLADFKGKFVVLEWMNPDCPFTQKHYKSGNMPATQRDAKAKGAVWLAVNTASKDTGDYRPPAELQTWMKAQNASETAVLMDSDSKIARAYAARTTPHMYIVDPQGRLIYAGAIDSKPTANPADVQTATNYVRQALGEALSGKPVSQSTTRAYGCAVKYSAG